MGPIVPSLACVGLLESWVTPFIGALGGESLFPWVRQGSLLLHNKW
jgi:hypothetical protein